MKQMTIAGAKGGDKPRTPVEAPDSLRSTAFARILDLVSEGEIVGLRDGLRSVFLDETPVANADGSLNFQNVQIESRTGTQDQPYIKGFPSVENEIVAGVELRPDQSFTRQISNLSLSAIRVRLSVQALYKTNMENGDISGHSVSYAIDIAKDGGAYQTLLTSAFSGKASNKYERSHRIDLPNATTGWNLRVRRLTPMANTASIADRTFVESYTEIIDAKLRYPNSALVGVTVDAEQFSSIPRRSYDLLGRIIRVPTNYDPVTRAYTGLWDGTFKPAWTDNPAWIFYDLATHKRYGLGHLVDSSQVDKWALYKIARYCDQLVPDGRGGMEPRFTCNLYLQTRADAYKVLLDLASVFRGITFWAGSSIMSSADMPEDPVYLYNASNVVEGKFEYAGSSRKARHTVALVSWNDLNDFGRLKVEYVEDLEGIQRYGVNQLEVAAIGCTSQGQAHRCGRWMLLTERYETDTVTFSVGLDGTLVAPGQIVMIADELRARRRLGGRIASATASHITVDKLPTPAPAPGHTLTAILPDGTSETRTIQAVDTAGNLIQVTPAFSSAPQVEAVWTVESPELMTQLYRVLGVSENEDLTYSITALQHEPGKFEAADTGVKLDERPTTPIPGSTQASPASVTLSSYERAGQANASTVVSASWPAAPGALHYLIQWRRDSGPWTPLARVDGLGADIENAFMGVYEARVAAVGQLATSQMITSLPLPVGDTSAVPGVIQDIHEELENWKQVQLETEQALAQEIVNRVAADTAESIERAEQIAEEARKRADDLANEAANRVADIQELAAETEEDVQELWNVINTLGAEISNITGAEEWDAAVEYEANDLVKFEGKLYRAIQDVPAGTPVSDASYWQLIGEYASLGDAVAGTVARVDSHEIRIGETEDGLEAVSQTVSQHVAQLEDAESGITANAQAIQAVIVRVEQTETSLSAISQDISTIESEIEGLASSAALQALETRVTETEGELESIAQALTDLTATVEDKADAAALQALQVRVTETEDLLESVASSLVDLESVIAGKADAAAVQALETRVTETEDTLESLSSSVLGLDAALDGKADASAVQVIEARVTETEDELASVSNSVTSLSARVGDDRFNLIGKSRFEDGEAGTWVGATVVDEEDLVGFTKALSIPTSSEEADRTFSITPGEILELAAWVNTEGRSSGAARLGIKINGAVITGPQLAAQTGWTRIVGEITVPFGATASASISVSGQGGAVLVNDIRVVRLSAKTQANANAISALDVRVTETEDSLDILASDITSLEGEIAGKADASALQTLEARVTETEDAIEASASDISSLQSDLAGKADASALQALTTRVTDAEDLNDSQSTALTSLEARVGESTDNLIHNPTFEDGDGSGWSGGATVVSSTAPGFSKALALTTTSYEETNYFTATEGEQFEFSALINPRDRTGGGSTQLTLHAVNASGTTIGYPVADGGIVSNSEGDWVRVTGIVTIPANVNRARPMLNVGGLSGPVLVTDLRLSRLNVATIGHSTAIQSLDARVTETEQDIEAHSAALTSLEASINGGFQAGRAWNFVESNEGFAALRGVLTSFTLPSNHGATAYTASAVDSNMTSPVFNPLPGKHNKYVRALIRRRTNSAFEGALYWATPGHGFSSTHTVFTSTPTPPWGAGEGHWHVVEWDLSQNSDWLTSDITQLRFDFMSGSGGTVDVRWIAIGDYGRPAASAQAAQVLEARVSSAEGQISSQASAITSLTSTLAGNLVPGKNLLFNPTGRAGVSGWTYAGVTGTTLQAFDDAGPNLRVVGGASAGIRNVFQDVSHPDMPGTTVTFSVDVWVSGNTTALSTFGIDMVGLGPDGTANWFPGNVIPVATGGAWRRLSITETVPAGTMTVRPRVRCINGTFSNFRFRNAKLEVGAVQTAYSDDVPYTSAMTSLQTTATRLENGQLQLLAKYSLALDVNGYVTGWTFNNDGTSGDLTILADRFRIVSPGSAPKTPFAILNGNVLINTDLHMGGGRIISRGGGYMNAVGTGFGVDNEFVEWFGPDMPLDLCSRQNGVMYKTRTGYFYARQVAQGNHEFSNVTSLVHPGATLSLTVNETSGGTIRVSVGYSRSMVVQPGNEAQTLGPGAGTSAAQVRLYRKIGSAAETLVGTYNFGGGVRHYGEAGVPATSYVTGAANYNDTSGGTANKVFRIEVVSSTLQNVVRIAGPNLPSPIYGQQVGSMNINTEE